MTETQSTEQQSGERTADDLIDAAELVEEQPLEERAAGYARLHDRLRDELDGR